MTESTLELTHYEPAVQQKSVPKSIQPDLSGPPSRSSEQDIADLPAPSTATHALQSWNNPKGNIWRVCAAYYAFIVVGLNDAAYGPLIPQLEKYYNLNYTVVSLIFLSPFAGYTLAAFLNSAIHMRFGQRGIAVLAPICHLIPFIVLSNHPPYPVLVVVFIIVGFGNGLLDAGWCAWTGNMVNANRVQGIMHAFYSGGGTVSPLIATAMTTKGGHPWYVYYYMMVRHIPIHSLLCTCMFADNVQVWCRIRRTGHFHLGLLATEQDKVPRRDSTTIWRARRPNAGSSQEQGYLALLHLPPGVRWCRDIAGRLDRLVHAQGSEG